MNAIILCGGLSTRLGEITKSIPKVLLEIKGKTVLDWQLEKLKSVGITEVVLAAGHLSETLRHEVGKERNGVKIIYAVEPERLGTGGAIKFAWRFLTRPQEPTVILNGDILTAVNIADMLKFLKPQSDGIILGSLAPDAASYGTLEYDKNYRLLKFKEKAGLHQSGFINGGFYIFNPHVTKHFPAAAAFSVEYDVFPKMEELDVYESNKPWVDIGVPERLDWARERWEN